MTNEIKSAIEFLIKETYCQFNKGDCDLDCEVCECNTDSYGYDEDTEKSIYDLAIRSLTAWEEVLQELENMRDIIWQNTDDEERIVRANAWDKIEILNKAIEVINQKLAEIEE